MKTRYRVTGPAQDHLDQIADYTDREWGRRQMTTYLRRLNDRFQWLADHPTLGKARPEINDTLRSFREGSHLIFYQVGENAVEIIAVLHQSMDVPAYFDD